MVTTRGRSPSKVPSADEASPVHLSPHSVCWAPPVTSASTAAALEDDSAASSASPRIRSEDVRRYPRPPSPPLEEPDAKRLRISDIDKDQSALETDALLERKHVVEPAIIPSDEQEIDEFEYGSSFSNGRIAGAMTMRCPYLDTINRRVLDFDFEKVCSVSLSQHNVYGCLVCGKYFQGRGPGSHAMEHSLQKAHHVWIHLGNAKIYCLPDGYEVEDPLLNDIKYNLHPNFTTAQVDKFDKEAEICRTLEAGSTYTPGVVGLNNMKANDWLNATLQAIMRVCPLRNYFLLRDPLDPNREAEALAHGTAIDDSHDFQLATMVSRAFGEWTRKFWNLRHYRAHVSPHEFLQAVSLASRKRFRPGIQSDPMNFLTWLLHQLHYALTGERPGRKRRKRNSVVTRVFQGELRLQVEAYENSYEDGDIAMGDVAEDSSLSVKTQDLLCISLDLPVTPLFRDDQQRNAIPQVSIFSLLSKFDGRTPQYSADGSTSRIALSRLPRYLILHFKRFVKNNFFIEKNHTLVNFPLTDLDMGPYLYNHEPPPTPEELAQMSIADLRAMSSRHGIEPNEYVEKHALCAAIHGRMIRSNRYNLVASVVHDGQPGELKGSYRAHVLNRADGAWYDIQDLHLHSTIAQLVSVAETYLQIWERQDAYD